jgi:hypothetical protein
MQLFHLVKGSIFSAIFFLQPVGVGKPHTDSVPPTMQGQIPKSRDVTLFFLRHDALQVSGHALYTSTHHVFLLNIFINKTERNIHFYWIHFWNEIQGLWFLASFRIFFSDNTRVRIFFFVAQSANFFSEFNIS